MAAPSIDITQGLTFRAAGFVFLTNRPPLDDPEQYNDYRRVTWTLQQLRSDLENGVLVPGLVITSDKLLSGVVVEDPDEGGQKVVPLKELLK